MSVLGKITGLILLFLGIVVIVIGVVTAVTGVLRGSQMGMFQQNPFMSPMMTTGFSVGLGAVIVLQGLILTAAGEGLYLIAGIAEHTLEARRLLGRRPSEPLS